MPIRQASIQITAEEHRARCQKLIEYLKAEDLSGAVLFDQDYVLYYSGFAFVATERPMAFLMNAEGERRLFVPRLELEHAQANAVVESVNHYLEYPDDPRCGAIFGCMDKAAYNYNAEATHDDGKCVYDLCSNIEGLQETMPEGAEDPDGDKICTRIPGPTPTSEPPIVPSVSFQQGCVDGVPVIGIDFSGEPGDILSIFGNGRNLEYSPGVYREKMRPFDSYAVSITRGDRTVG